MRAGPCESSQELSGECVSPKSRSGGREARWGPVTHGVLSG